MKKGEDLEGYDWRKYKTRGWPYSSDAPQNKKWQKPMNLKVKLEQL